MDFDPEKITFFAKTDARGQDVKFGIKAKDRQRHMYVVGKTGMGKSTLLENMAVQDIQNGEGMAFIDPHGSAAETLLEYIPEHRVNDVIYFAPFDLDNPISFNVMEDVGIDKRHLVVSGLMSTFKKIWVDAWSARMEYILTNALLVLIEYPDTTLISVNRLFSDKAYRKKVVDYCQDPAVKSFWVDEFANYTERFAAEALPAIQNKIGQFTGNPLIRNIIGQPHSSFDFRKCMDEKKIVIMNLSKGLIGETNANLLGSMLTTRIYLAAMSRADLPVAEMKKMPNFYFYVDEFQSFANATFANILSEARKYHLNLIIAHQYIEQMEEEVRDAVFGNVGTTITFRVGPFDAETLETVFTPRFLAPDLINLGFAQIYLTLMIDGIGSQPFSASTLPPIEPPRISCKNMAIAASRKNYTKSREEVEKIVNDLHNQVTKVPKNNKQSESPPDKINSSPRTVRSDSSRNNDSRPKDKKKNTTKAYSNNSAAVATPAVTSEAKNERTETTNNRNEVPIKPVRKGDYEGRTKNTDSNNQNSNSDRFSSSKDNKKTPESTDDLRAILASIAGNTASLPVKEPKTSVDEKQTTVETAPTALRSALAEALKSVPLAPDTPKENSADKPAPKKTSTKKSTAAQKKPEPKHDELAEFERLAAEAEATFADLESNSTTNTQTQAQSERPDPKQISKILRTPGAQRSPFK